MFYVLSGNDFLCGAVTVVEMRIRWRSEGGHGGRKFHLFVTVITLHWTEVLALQTY